MNVYLVLVLIFVYGGICFQIGRSTARADLLNAAIVATAVAESDTNDAAALAVEGDDWASDEYWLEARS